MCTVYECGLDECVCMTMYKYLCIPTIYTVHVYGHAMMHYMYMYVYACTCVHMHTV